MAVVDYYKTLEITKSASEADIKKAYRKLARKYHPDVNPNDKNAEKNFKEINEANEVLSNPENRKKYDTYGEHWQNGEAYQQEKQRQQEYQERAKGAQGGYSQEDFSEMFGGMFGGSSSGRSTNSKFRGQDYNSELKLNIQDVYTTQKQVITVNGKSIRITIPAGVENGQIIKIKGHGGKGVNNGPNGDLYIQFSIVNNSRFKRDKENLHVAIDLDLYTALLGGQLVVATFDGNVKLTIKPETVNGTQVKLKGKGFPVYKKEGQFGDLYITYQLKIPTNLNEKEIELIKELQKQR
ncbi:DnaJ C-terminal domain-containing protein [Polaribacter glomeratus]|uniref:Molecular chaperone DnaJ n=1 Tax=Polaribacter glomeratus TaxID=102 RepID=A0A2S7WGC5_9FLAO|nr:J domain-containing protein [Polaribacter glomeratus]PQJ76665.1 molecular chaperone DnaJ [Polaribacter glomeratus]TXD67496.1 J domain-containing protein [Polaribacter glomeratus]